MGKLKAEYSPEEWQRYLARQKERRSAGKWGKKTKLSPEQWAAYLEKRRAYQQQRYAAMTDPEKKESNRNRHRKNMERYARNEPSRELYLERKRLYRVRHRTKIRTFPKPAKIILPPVRLDPALHIRTRAMSVQMYREIMAAIPSRYQLETREDIASEAVILMLDGAGMSVRDAVAIGIKRHFGMFSKFNTVSLDEDHGDGFRMIDMIAGNHMENFLP